MIERYIDLIINKCMNLESKSVFINYSIEISEFINKIVLKLKELGVSDIYLDWYNPHDIHDYLMKHTLEEISVSDKFDSRIWDIYAGKKASFLIFETEYPGLYDDVDADKVSVMGRRKRETRPLYREMVEKCTLSWSILAFPGKMWANFLNVSYEELEKDIYDVCMLNSNNYLEEWDRELKRRNVIINNLNRFKFSKLCYKNKLGTDLVIELPDDYVFASAMDNIMVNMPSYEIFASPKYDGVNGSVYASMPLYYNNVEVSDIYLRFEKGKVVEYRASKGIDILKGIIETDSNSCYLGECALVEVCSPIAKLNKVFATTLIDENASCHLALGAGFSECIKDGINKSRDELLELGINQSKTHVDFMIGTDDMSIKGISRDGREIDIFVDGIFSKDILDENGIN